MTIHEPILRVVLLPMTTTVRISACSFHGVVQIADNHGLAGLTGCRDKTYGSMTRTNRPEDTDCFGQLMHPSLATGIVEGGHEVGRGHGFQSPADDFPREPANRSG